MTSCLALPIMFEETIVNQRQQLVILLGLSVAVVLCTIAAYFLDRLVFKRFLGAVNPILASIVIVLLGGALLLFFLARGWFAIYTAGNPMRFLWAAGLVVLLATFMVLVDGRAVLPKDLNAPFPQSLFFYPAAGYAAEVLFHLLPLFILLIVPVSLLKSLQFEQIIWPCIIIVSFIEPVFQARPLFGKYPLWVAAYVFLNVWVISIAQLALFRRYDFVSMYAFRLMYYLLWHIIWGHARLSLLF